MEQALPQLFGGRHFSSCAISDLRLFKQLAVAAESRSRAFVAIANATLEFQNLRSFALAILLSRELHHLFGVISKNRVYAFVV